VARLALPPFELSTIGSRTFKVAVAQVIDLEHYLLHRSFPSTVTNYTKFSLIDWLIDLDPLTASNVGYVGCDYEYGKTSTRIKLLFKLNEHTNCKYMMCA